MLERRGLVLCLLTAPFIVRSGILMPVSKPLLPETLVLLKIPALHEIDRDIEMFRRKLEQSLNATSVFGATHEIQFPIRIARK